MHNKYSWKILMCALFVMMLVIPGLSFLVPEDKVLTDKDLNVEIEEKIDKDEDPGFEPVTPNENEQPDIRTQDEDVPTIKPAEQDEITPGSSFENEDVQKTGWNLNEFDGYFIENRGQLAEDNIRFYSPDGGIWFTDDGAWFNIKEKQDDETIKGTVVKMEFADANLITPVGKSQKDHENNFLIGSEPDDWLTGVPGFNEVYYEDLYDGIDLRFYLNEDGLKYDFLVHPGADPSMIKIKYVGSDSIEINENNDLIIKTQYAEIHDKDLYIYQPIGGMNFELAGSIELLSDCEYGFSLENDHYKDQLLIIDPVLSYCTYVGGSGYERGGVIAVDKYGFAYVAARSTLGWPTTPGAYDTSYNNINTSMYPPPSHGDVVVFKLDRNGSKLIYSTYIGGDDLDEGLAITIDADGNAFVTGRTKSLNFPTTEGAYDRVNNYTGISRHYDPFVLKLDKNGSKLIYSTFIGGSSFDTGNDIAIDGSGNAFISGETYSNDFPTTSSAYDRTYNGGNRDSFAVKLNPTGTKLVYSTLIGGSNDDHIYAFDLDSNDRMVMVGYTHSGDFPVTTGAYNTSFNNWSKSEAVALKLSKDGSKILCSTFFGGKRLDVASGVVLDSNDNIYVAGSTRSSDFPVNARTYTTVSAAWNVDHVFVVKFDKDLTTIINSTVIGGSSPDLAQNIDLDSKGNVYVVGDTYSSDFPITKDALRNASSINTFLLRLNKDFSELNYSTCLGISSWLSAGLDVDNAGLVFISGSTISANLPTTKGVYSENKSASRDLFVMKFKFNENEPPSIISFSSGSASEGSSVIFNVSAVDPENDTLSYAFDFQADGVFDVTGPNSTAKYLWADDHSGEAVVKVSDGVNEVTAKAVVNVLNVAPTIDLQYQSQSTDVQAVLFVRIAGEKWHDVKVELYKDDVLTASETLIRYPGSPNEQMLNFSDHTIDDSSDFRAEVYYTPEDDPVNGKTNGATPCWVILQKQSGDEVKIHHTFNVKHEDTHEWSVDLTSALASNATGNNVTFFVKINDPGCDALSLYLDCGDGYNTTINYPNNNQLFPVVLEVTLNHLYQSSGTFTVELLVRDDDGGFATIKITIDV